MRRTQAALPGVRPLPWAGISLVMFGLMGVAWAVLVSVGQDPLAKPGGWLLIGLLCSAITFWLAQTIATGNVGLIARALLVALLLIGSYAIGFALIDGMITVPESMPTAANSAWYVGLSLMVLSAFVSLFIFQVAILSPGAADRLRAWQVHAANGFYMESWLRRRFWLLRS